MTTKMLSPTPHLDAENNGAVKPVPVTEFVYEASPQATETLASNPHGNNLGVNGSGNQNTSPLNPDSDGSKELKWITWTAFYGIWFFWLMCCFSTFMAFEVIVGTIGGGALGKYKLEVLGFKIPTKHLLSGVFAGSLEVGSLVATWLSRTTKETKS